MPATFTNHLNVSLRKTLPGKRPLRTIAGCVCARRLAANRYDGGGTARTVSGAAKLRR
jgi:hypothetical protein